MRHVRLIMAMLCAVLFAAACSDAPTAPDGIAVREAGPSSAYLLEPVIVIGKCDPYMSLDWCGGSDPGGEDCMTSAGGSDLQYTSGCYSGGGAPGPGGGGTPGGGDTPPDGDGECNPNTNPDCLQRLSSWDKETLRHGLARHLRTDFTDPNAAQMCNALATQFDLLMTGGMVYLGAYASTGEPNDPHHVAAYDPNGGTVHFEADAMTAARTGDPIAIRNLINSALHEAAHSLNYNHTNPVWMGSYDLYLEPPFNLLSPGTNSCITNW